MKLRMTVEVPDERIGDLLCSALEGGSNYWYVIDTEASTTPDDLDLDYWHEVPFVKGGRISFMDKEAEDGKHFVLDRAKVEKGLRLMARKQPRHFANFMQENDDSDTGDVFLQMCLFGDVIYG